MQFCVWCTLLDVCFPSMPTNATLFLVIPLWVEMNGTKRRRSYIAYQDPPTHPSSVIRFLLSRLRSCDICNPGLIFPTVTADDKFESSTRSKQWSCIVVHIEKFFLARISVVRVKTKVKRFSRAVNSRQYNWLYSLLVWIFFWNKICCSFFSCWIIHSHSISSFSVLRFNLDSKSKCYNFQDRLMLYDLLIFLNCHSTASTQV